MKTGQWALLAAVVVGGALALQSGDKNKKKGSTPSGGGKKGSTPSGGGKKWTAAQVKAANDEAAASVAYWKKQHPGQIAEITNFPIIVDGQVVGRKVTVTLKDGTHSQSGFPYAAM